MATLVLGFVGNAIGGPIGGKIGMLLGSIIDQQLFAPRVDTSGGARMDDLKLTSSTEGIAIPVVYGTARTSGNIIWGTQFIEHKKDGGGKRGKGGGGKSGGGSTETYYYTISFALALCRGPIVGVNRIWIDGKIQTPSYTLHTGTETQVADSFMQAHMGANNVPAYRGLAYMVFQDFEVTDYGNRVPNITVEVITSVTTLGAIIKDISSEVALLTSDTDVTSLDSTAVKGIIYASQNTMRERIEQLQLAYLFDVTEQNGVVIFKKRAVDAIPTVIEHDEMGAVENSFSAEERSGLLTTSRKYEMELPKKIILKYLDTDKEYQQGTQSATREVVKCVGETTINVDIALNGTEAKTIAEAILYEAWIQRLSHECVVNSSYLSLAPGNTVRLIDKNDKEFIASVTKTQFGKPGIVKISAVGATNTMYTVPDRYTDLPVIKPVQAAPVLKGQIKYHALDIPQVDLGSTLYPIIVANTGNENFQRLILYRGNAAASAFADIQTLLNPATIGVTQTTLLAGSLSVFDYVNSLEVVLDYGTLESHTETEILSDVIFNVALIDNEIIQYTSATLIGQTPEFKNIYRITGLLRGRLGTEGEISNHNIGGRFIVLSVLNAYNIPMVTSDWNTSINYRLGSNKASVSDNDHYHAFTFTSTGRAYKPLAPVHVEGKISGNDIIINWKRRTRGDGTWKNGQSDHASLETLVGNTPQVPEVPLSEEREEYAVEIYDMSNNLKRTITALTNSYTYTEAEQLTDFGSVQTRIQVKVAQVSVLYGRGAISALTKI